MPTLNYEIKLECENCGEKQTEKVPQGSQFIPYEEIGQTFSGDPLIRESGYFKGYGKADKKTIKRCKNCRTAMLVREV